MNYNKMTKGELITKLLNTKQELDVMKGIFISNTDYQNQLEFNLKERLKELKCHNRISEFLSKPDLTADEVIEKIVNIIPEALQFPELAEASIKIGDKINKTSGFKRTVHSMVQDITSENQIIGQIEVCYPTESVPDTKNLFLTEEADLLFSIAVRTGNFIEKTHKDILLFNSEKKIRNLIENINDIIYEYDRHGIITFISPVVEKTFGYTPAEVVGQSFTSFVGGDKTSAVKLITELQEKKEIHTEYNIATKAGEKRWVDLSTRAVYEGNDFAGGAGTLSDITEKKKMEMEFQRSELLYRSILNSVPDTVTISDLDGKILFVSPSANKMFGYAPSFDFSNHSNLDFIDISDHEKTRSDIRKMFRNEFNGSAEYTGIKADGIKFDIEVNGEFIRDAEGQPVNMIFVTRDISSRKQSEHLLRKLSRAVEQSPVSIVITNLDGDIEYANPKARETTGYSLEELFGKNPRVLQSGETPQKDYVLLWETIGSGNVWHGTF
jgi:PAS domain S-box-containing protein